MQTLVIDDHYEVSIAAEASGRAPSAPDNLLRICDLFDYFRVYLWNYF